MGVRHEKTEVSGVKVDVKTEYRKDHTFSGKGTVEVAGRVIETGVEGTWKIEGDVLSFKVTQSKTPEMLPVGSVGSDTILKLTRKEFRYRDQDGDEFTAVRVPPSSEKGEKRSPER